MFTLPYDEDYAMTVIIFVTHYHVIVSSVTNMRQHISLSINLHYCVGRSVLPKNQ